jgi:hypothetical protein
MRVSVEQIVSTLTEDRVFLPVPSGDDFAQGNAYVRKGFDFANPRIREFVAKLTRPGSKAAAAVKGATRSR